MEQTGSKGVQREQARAGQRAVGGKQHEQAAERRTRAGRQSRAAGGGSRKWRAASRIAAARTRRSPRSDPLQIVLTSACLCGRGAYVGFALKSRGPYQDKSDRVAGSGRQAHQAAG